VPEAGAGNPVFFGHHEAGRTANIIVLWNITRGRGGRLGLNPRPAHDRFYWDGSTLVTRQKWNKQHENERFYPLYIDARSSLPFPVWELREAYTIK